MNIENISIDAIKPYSRNAKKHDKKQIDAVAKSIERFGWASPVVIDKNNELIIGHCRVLAAKKLQIKEIPALRMENLSDDEVKALRLADNKLNESDWDMGLAIDELKGLDSDLFDLTGFDKDLIIEPDAQDDVIPDNPPAISKLGDLYELGQHRVLCGDATKREDVERLMDGKKADMVFTDPPYNIAYKGQGKNTSNEIIGDDVMSDAFDIFLSKVFANFKEFTKAGGGNYVFHASRTQIAFEQALANNNYIIKNQLIWNKPMSALGWGDYRWKHEPFFYCGQKGQLIQFYGDRTRSTVWDFQKSEQQLLNWAKRQKIAEQNGKTTIWSMKRDNVNGYVHPTQKPVELICYAIINSTKTDDIVLDLFGGSGSTMIASEKMGRTAYSMELDPKYVDVIVQRYVDYTGNENIIKNGEKIVWRKKTDAI